MNSQRPVSTHRSPLAVLALLFAACGGGGLSGVYTPTGGAGFFEKLTFTSGKTVEITFMGQTRELTYQVDGKKLKIISPNSAETQIFSLDNTGCFDGGGLLGKYCRTGGNSATASSGSTGSLAGIWEAKAPGGSFRLTFSAGGKVQMTMQDDGGNPESHDGSYTLSGSQVTISAPGGVPLQLTHKGNTLEGAFGGMTMTFTQQ